jgi:hypothetical protein
VSGRVLFVVPCGRAKLARPAPARELYTGAMFTFGLAVVEAEADLTAELGVDTRVAILSARHGLLHPDTVVEPYDHAMTQPGSATADALAVQLADLLGEQGGEVYAFLPKAYLARVQAAATMADRRATGSVLVHDVFEAAPGIGYQRQVLANIRRSHTARTGHDISR